MPVNSADLEAAIRKAIAVSHIEVEDQSSGCGESYAVVIVSEIFRGKSTLARHRMGTIPNVFVQILRLFPCC
ncbi:bola-like protein [Amanita muscaria]